jgi:hypothetical protein
MNVTIRVTAPAGRLIPGIGSFEKGETFELPEEEAQRLVERATGLEIDRPTAAPGQRRKEPGAPKESEE